MNLADYLKYQLTDFVNVYKKYYSKTFGTTVIFSLVVFAITAMLLNFSLFDKASVKKQISLLSYFFSRYSYAYTYSIVDLAKTVFIFFVSIFSIALTRLQLKGASNYNFCDFLKNIRFQDFGFLGVAFFISSICDYFLFKADTYSLETYKASLVDIWISGVIFMLRIYTPLIVFSLFSAKILEIKFKIRFKLIFFLLASLWIFNEFANEFMALIRGRIFNLFALPFPDDKRYIVESILGILLISFYFLGYYSAMVNSINFLQQKPEV